MLSVDDWGWRKKQRYGTMLMDLARPRVIDLLPVRSAESFAHWLGLHPEVEVITRDRSGLLVVMCFSPNPSRCAVSTTPETIAPCGDQQLLISEYGCDHRTLNMIA